LAPPQERHNVREDRLPGLKPWAHGAALAGALLATPPVVAAESNDERPLSPAQVALFESNHLKEIRQPVVLDYNFHHRGAPGGDFADKVSADIRAVHDDGRKDVWIDFLTGAHHVNFPPALGFNGNPLLMFFLEHDVNEMHDVAGGASQYFRNRIRAAFLDRAEMHSVEIEVNGAKHPATEIALSPFRDDPNLARFPGFAGKTYRFILSDTVPGTLYEISTTMPDAGDATGTFQESLTYAGEHAETP
jgi:hypothetical protein